MAMSYYYSIPDGHTIDTGVNIASPLHKLLLLLVQGSRSAGSLSLMMSCLISRKLVKRVARSFCFLTFSPNKSLYLIFSDSSVEWNLCMIVLQRSKCSCESLQGWSSVLQQFNGQSIRPPCM